MSNVRDVKQKNTTIVLKDGVERTLVYDLNAMAELEEVYGSVDEAFAQLDKNSIKAIRCILWAGLIHAEPDLTEKQVGALIDMQYLQEIMGNLTEAFGNDMPVIEQQDSANPNQ